MSETKSPQVHDLKLDVARSPKLGPKVKMQRHFKCVCGQFEVYGYDNHVMAAYRAHKKSA